MRCQVSHSGHRCRANVRYYLLLHVFTSSYPRFIISLPLFTHSLTLLILFLPLFTLSLPPSPYPPPSSPYPLLALSLPSPYPLLALFLPSSTVFVPSTLFSPVRPKVEIRASGSVSGEGRPEGLLLLLPLRSQVTGARCFYPPCAPLTAWQTGREEEAGDS